MSEAVAEVDVSAVHAPGTDLAPYAAGVAEEYRPRIVMQPEEARELDQQLRACMRAVLVDGVDFGTIPGAGDKKNLLKPGAEKLIQWFGFGFANERDEIERDGDGNRIGVTYRCVVYKEMPDGRKVTVATCEGYAGYDEDRYYTSAENARAKAEANERKWARKDNRAPKPEKWENASEYKAPWNTVLKMAQKRALVGAAIDATAAAGLFTQDLEDMKGQAAESGTAFTGAAMSLVMSLPENVRGALDSWYRGQRWPDPGYWTPEQWCAALREAGALSVRLSQSQPAKETAPDGGEARQPGRVQRPAQPQSPAPPDETDKEAQLFAGQARDARMLSDLENIFKAARAAGKLGVNVTSPESGKSGKLGVYLDWRRRQLTEADKALTELTEAAGGAGIGAETVEEHLIALTGKTMDDATPAELRQAAAALRERAA